jgi:hypothetical protein
MPDMVYIIDKSGKIAYKSKWTDHEEIARSLRGRRLLETLK